MLRFKIFDGVNIVLAIQNKIKNSQKYTQIAWLLKKYTQIALIGVKIEVLLGNWEEVRLTSAAPSIPPSISIHKAHLTM